MFGGKALGWMAGPLIWMPGAQWARAGQTYPPGPGAAMEGEGALFFARGGGGGNRSGSPSGADQP